MTPFAAIHSTALAAVRPALELYADLRTLEPEAQNAVHALLDQHSPATLVTIRQLEPVCGPSAAVG